MLCPAPPHCPIMHRRGHHMWHTQAACGACPPPRPALQLQLHTQPGPAPLLTASRYEHCHTRWVRGILCAPAHPPAHPCPSPPRAARPHHRLPPRRALRGGGRGAAAGGHDGAPEPRHCAHAAAQGGREGGRAGGRGRKAKLGWGAAASPPPPQVPVWPPDAPPSSAGGSTGGGFRASLVPLGITRRARHDADPYCGRLEGGARLASMAGQRVGSAGSWLQAAAI